MAKSKDETKKGNAIALMISLLILALIIIYWIYS